MALVESFSKNFSTGSLKRAVQKNRLVETSQKIFGLLVASSQYGCLQAPYLSFFRRYFSMLFQMWLNEITPKQSCIYYTLGLTFVSCVFGQCVQSVIANFRQFCLWQDGLIIENMHDIPYTLEVGPEVCASMTAVCAAVRGLYPSWPLGVQILSAANQSALAVALASGVLMTVQAITNAISNQSVPWQDI